MHEFDKSLQLYIDDIYGDIKKFIEENNYSNLVTIWYPSIDINIYHEFLLETQVLLRIQHSNLSVIKEVLDKINTRFDNPDAVLPTTFILESESQLDFESMLISHDIKITKQYQITPFSIRNK